MMILLLVLALITVVVSLSTVRYLETNSWVFTVGKTTVLIDPVLSTPLDFGIPWLYSGKKRTIDGPKEVEILAQSCDYILLSQGLDDHTHSSTVKDILRRRKKPLKFIAPKSSVPILRSAGVDLSNVDILSPGDRLKFNSEGRDSFEVLATTGALVGPPWQANENGYIIRAGKTSLYYEPHCMYDESELSRYQVDYVISPLVSQNLPFFTLVDGGDKAIRLAEILKAKAIIPMANGELEQSGILANIIRKGESAEAIICRMSQDKKFKAKIFDVKPGVSITLR